MKLSGVNLDVILKSFSQIQRSKVTAAYITTVFLLSLIIKTVSRINYTLGGLEQWMRRVAVIIGFM